MNERPLLGRGKGGLIVHLWVLLPLRTIGGNTAQRRLSQAGTTAACLSICGTAFRILGPPGRLEMGNGGSSNGCDQAVG